MKKFKIIFKYLEYGTYGYKYIKADSKKTAMETFNKIYKEAAVEIKQIVEVDEIE